MAWESNNPASDNLYVKGLPEEFTSEAVNQFFSACGTVVSAKTVAPGAALVRFASEEEATMVKDAMNGQQPMGCNQPITISFGRTKGVGKGGVVADDWYCPACGDLQFAKNLVCRMCGSGRDDAAAAAGGCAAAAGGCKGGGKKGGGKALQAAGDWNCTQCGDMQFARNTECRQCGCPKNGWPAGGFGKAAGKGGAAGPYGKSKGKGFKKSKLCSNFEEGWCPRGDMCTFAHGEHELGTYQPGEGGGAAPAVQGWQSGGYTGRSDASSIKGLVDGLIAEGLPGADSSKDSNALYVTNLPHDTTDEDLYIIFGSFGALPPRGVRVMPTQPGARSYAFVNFMEPANAEFAMMAMNGVTQPDGAKLFVKQKTKKGEGDMGAAGGGGFAVKPMSGASPGVTPAMMARLQKKLSMGMMSSYDISQWYIIEFLGHVTDEKEMQNTCDMLLTACSHLGLA